jgi:hypothetical protein
MRQKVYKSVEMLKGGQASAAHARFGWPPTLTCVGIKQHTDQPIQKNRRNIADNLSVV